MFNKEQLEALIITIKENISLAESLLKTQEYEDAEAVKSMLASQKKVLQDYTERWEWLVENLEDAEGSDYCPKCE